MMMHFIGMKRQKLLLARILTALVLFCTVFFLAANLAYADDPLCWNYPTNWSGTGMPTIDGVITTDPGWTEANQYVFGNGTSQPDAIVQMLQDYNQTKLYLSFQVNHDDHYNIADKIILLLGPDPNDPTKDWRIHVHPVSNSGNAGGAPFKIEVWRDSTTWASRAQTPDQTNPAWITARVIAVDGPADTVNPSFGTKDNSYFVEIALNTTNSLANTDGIYYAAGSTMKLYFNILRVYKVMVSGIEFTRVQGQLNWPMNSLILGVPSNPTTDQLFNSPLRAAWGDAIMASSSAPCSGVQVSRHWINDVSNTSVLSPPALGATSVTNNYYVELKNTGTAPGEKILATIKSRRFGIANLSTFGNIPASPNPLGPSGTILSGQTTTLGPAAWTLSSVDFQNDYDPLAYKNYVCSLVQLDVDPSASSRVLIANRYSYWNTHFGTGSTFKHTAVLDATGFEKPHSGDTQYFDLKIFTKDVSQILNPGKTMSVDVKNYDIKQRLREDMLQRELHQVNAEGLFKEGVKLYAKTVCGFRSTKRYIKMDGVTMELMEKTPCYGYWVKHRGEISRWTDKLDMGKLTENSNSGYTMGVKGSADLTSIIEAVEPQKPCGCGDFKCYFGRTTN